MNAARDYVFGYGSLVRGAENYSRDPSPSGYVTELQSFRRGWGVAMDNLQDLPGYKHYLNEGGERPGIFVAFLDLKAAAGDRVNGVCRPVGRQDLSKLDDRERNYSRIDVTDAVTQALGRVWAYVGSSEGRARFSMAVEQGRAVVSREYLTGVEQGFRALGPAEYRAFRRNSDLDDLPVRELTRIDSPNTPRPRPV